MFGSRRFFVEFFLGMFVRSLFSVVQNHQCVHATFKTKHVIPIRVQFIKYEAKT